VREKVEKQCWVIIKNFAVRYCHDFIIATNCKIEVIKIRFKVWEFLSVRGLKVKIHSNRVLELDTGQTFDFLGFTFKFIGSPKLTQKIKKLKKKGLFVYVSNSSIQNLKNEINFELKFICRSVCQLITQLNFIIKKWAHYFAVGHREIFSKVDWYIFRRCFRFISKKFPRVTKTFIAFIFFCYRRGTTCWNFNAFRVSIKKNSQLAHVVLARICSIVRFIPVSKLCPYNRELLNPFVNFQAKKLWLERISKLRYGL